MSDRDEAVRLAMRVINRETGGMTFEVTDILARALLDAVAEVERLKASLEWEAAINRAALESQERLAAEVSRLKARTLLLGAALSYLQRKIDGYDTTFETAEEIVAGTVSPDGMHRIAKVEP